MSTDLNRWLVVAGGLLTLIGGVMCALLGWICLTITNLSVTVAEIRKELEMFCPREVQQSIHEIDNRLTTVEKSQP
jgi:hypothetical protein